MGERIGEGSGRFVGRKQVWKVVEALGLSGGRRSGGVSKEEQQQDDHILSVANVYVACL